MASYSDEGFEKLAGTVRIELGIDDQTRVDAIDFLRRLKQRGYISDYIRLPDSGLQDAEAKFNPADKKIYLRQSVYRRAENGVPHDRFTVFHEGAHGHQYERKRSFSAQAQAEKRVHSIRKDEGDADKLAIAIMAPLQKADFSLEVAPEEIGRRFGLSAKASTLRYEEFAGMFRRANGLRRPLPNGVADFLTEQRRRGYFVTSLPPEEIASIKPKQDCYTGDVCPNPACGQFSMVRTGAALRCEACGCALGDD